MLNLVVIPATWEAGVRGSQVWGQSRQIRENLFQKIKQYKKGTGAREMTQWLRTPVAYAEDPGSIPRSLMVTHNHLMPSSDLGEHQGYMWYT